MPKFSIFDSHPELNWLFSLWDNCETFLKQCVVKLNFKLKLNLVDVSI